MYVPGVRLSDVNCFPSKFAPLPTYIFLLLREIFLSFVDNDLFSHKAMCSYLTKFKCYASGSVKFMENFNFHFAIHIYIYMRIRISYQNHLLFNIEHIEKTH